MSWFLCAYGIDFLFYTAPTSIIRLILVQIWAIFKLFFNYLTAFRFVFFGMKFDELFNKLFME